ncbi:segregation/condensation protein A [bacterium]|nr:segregation/condensation protein A [bacterium]
MRLPNFEGPLDLLCFLIKKEEIDIYDIPIAQITKQYLAYVDLMRELDLEVAGEFILMAATLIQIKVKMLLPRAPEEEAEEEDPRADLVRQLLEYRRYKEVAESLQSYEDRQSRVFHRSYFEWQKPYRQKEVVLKDMTMFDLLSAFRDVLSNMPKVRYHEVQPIGVTIEEQIDYVLNGIGDRGHVLFRDLLSPITERIIMVVTFMAILELIKSRRISVRQSDVFGEIFIMRREPAVQLAIEPAGDAADKGEAAGPPA